MITYTNDAKSIIDALYGILTGEFSDIYVVYEDQFNPEYLGHQKYLRFFLAEDRNIEMVANGEVREYEIQFALYFNLDHMQEREDFAIYTDYAERLKQLLHDNNNYAPASAYKWHDSRVQTIVYPVGIGEEEEINGYENIKAIYITASITRSNFWS